MKCSSSSVLNIWPQLGPSPLQVGQNACSALCAVSMFQAMDLSEIASLVESPFLKVLRSHGDVVLGSWQWARWGGFGLDLGVWEVLPCLQLGGAALGDATCLFFSITLIICVPDLCCSEQQLCPETRLTKGEFVKDYVMEITDVMIKSTECLFLFLTSFIFFLAFSSDRLIEETIR